MLRRAFLSGVPLVLGAAAAAGGFRLPASAASVLEYGARPDGKTLNTKSIQSAIDRVFQDGGGVVNIPSGTFLTGRIELKSGVTLNLQTGSTLLGSTSIDDYKAHPESDGNGPAAGRHLIFAQDAENITITGSGVIDGQGPSFWEPSAPVPPSEEWAGVASHDLAPKKSGRPSPMLEFANCRGLQINGIRIQNSPGWTLRTVNCDSVEVQGITIRNPINGPNTDGIDIVCSQRVRISNCTIFTGDDAICLKSETPYGGEPRLVKDVTVSDCTLTTCCNGFKIGTGSEGGFETITFSNSFIVNDEVPFKERVISGVALEVVDGGWIDGVVITGIRMQRARTPIFIRLGNRKEVYHNPQRGLRGVRIEDVQATETLLASSITGLAGMEVSDVTLSHIDFESVLPGRPEWARRAVPEKETAYPEARMFGMLPATGLYARHARDLNLNDATFRAPEGEMRSTVILEDVVGAHLTGIKSTPVSGAPIIQVIGSKDVKISESITQADAQFRA
jgi:polygalacturonase